MGDWGILTESEVHLGKRVVDKDHWETFFRWNTLHSYSAQLIAVTKCNFRAAKKEERKSFLHVGSTEIQHNRAYIWA